MKKRRSQFISTSLLVYFVCGVPFLTGVAYSKESSLAQFDLEPSLRSAALVMAVRVDEVRPVRIIHGGKGSQTIHQYTFTPTGVLKGVYSRPELLMTSADLQSYNYNFDPTDIQVGEHRLLILGRSNAGFYGSHRGSTTDQSYPRLSGSADPILDAARSLLAQQEIDDRKEIVVHLVRDLPESRAGGTVVLLAALARRSDIAHQYAPSVHAVARKLRSNNAGVREAAARTLGEFFAADYLENRTLREPAVIALIASLENPNPLLAPRVAALQALALAPDSLRDHSNSKDLLTLDSPSETIAEFSARLDILGGIYEDQAGDAAESLANLIGELPLDAPDSLQGSAMRALARIAGEDGVSLLFERLQRKKLLGLGAVTEIQAIGWLFGRVADTWSLQKALIDIDLTYAEQLAFVRACADSPSPELVPALSGMLDPRHPQLRRMSADLLMKIDTKEAARVLRAHLAEEANLDNKLRLSEFLGRHGFDDGYSYALEHMSDPRYLDAAVGAIAAIEKAGSTEQMLEIYRNSNDVGWRQAAIRALGLLGHTPFQDELRTLTSELGHPLAPAALQARADLGDTQVRNVLPDALKSRSEAVVVAAARAAAALFSRDATQNPRADREFRRSLLALAKDQDISRTVRQAALDALVVANDPDLFDVLIAMVRDRGLERTDLLNRVRELLRERGVDVWGA